MRNLRKYLLALVAATTITVAAHAQSPTGNWSVDANGFTCIMTLNVNPAGTVTGSLFGNVIKGFYNFSTKRLMIYRAVNGTTFSTPPEQIQVYDGYMFPALASNPAGPQRFAGEFRAFAGTGATPILNVFGWYAWK